MSIIILTIFTFKKSFVQFPKCLHILQKETEKVSKIPPPKVRGYLNKVKNYLKLLVNVHSGTDSLKHTRREEVVSYDILNHITPGGKKM